MSLPLNQMNILLSADRNARGIVQVEAGIRSNRARPRYGTREVAAARRLAGQGLLKIVAIEPFSHDKGWGHVHTYAITDAGSARAAQVQA